MNLIVVHSMNGGTGRTTVACNLASQLTALGRRCVLLDADSSNGVGLYLGMQYGERFGMWSRDLGEADLAAYRRRNPSKVPHIPFGFCTWAERLELERRRLDHPDWLMSRINALAPADVEAVVVDLPAGLAPWMAPALRAARVVLQVVAPDGPSFASLPLLAQMVHEFDGPASMAYLVNGMDARKALSKDVQDAMASLLGEQLLSITIPLDESLRESFAQQRPICEHAPESQAAQSFRTLATWVASRLEPPQSGGST